jgi:hypothetical protein
MLQKLGKLWGDSQSCGSGFPNIHGGLRTTTIRFTPLAQPSIAVYTTIGIVRLAPPFTTTVFTIFAELRGRSTISATGASPAMIRRTPGKSSNTYLRRRAFLF